MKSLSTLSFSFPFIFFFFFFLSRQQMHLKEVMLEKGNKGKASLQKPVILETAFLAYDILQMLWVQNVWTTVKVCLLTTLSEAHRY